MSRRVVALALVLFGLGGASRGDAPAGDSSQERISFVLPAANFQPVPDDAYQDNGTPLVPPIPDEPLMPPSMAPTPENTESPEPSDAETLMPSPACEPSPYESCQPNGYCLPEGRLPNGQYPDNWTWGCGGSPYRNGPGMCDDWKVGPIWDVTVDGIVMTREHTDLDALDARADELDGVAVLADPEITEQFDRGAGGRVFLTGLVPRSAGYQVVAGYEGIEEWNAALIYPKIILEDLPVDTTERRSVTYRSSFHSGELNIQRLIGTAWRPFSGVRYIKFDDEIRDFNDQDAGFPLPGPMPDTVTATDTLNLFDVENNMVGFQAGLRRDLWNIGRRFSLQGFANTGVYYNKIKRSNLMSMTTTQFIGDDTDPPADPMDPIVDESRTDVSTTTNLSIAERSDVAYVAEAALTGVCRLNRCWAVRAGYQVLWMDGVSLAEDAYLDTGVETRSLIFHGWHAGVECRR